VVEILHPKDEKNNPACAISEKAKQNPGELLIFGNPESGYIRRSLHHQLEAAAKERGETIKLEHVASEGRNKYRYQGKLYTPGELADHLGVRWPNSKRERQRAARERSARIRKARLNPKAGKPPRDNPRAFAGWKHFTKKEKNFLRSIHMPAPRSEEDVRAYKESLKKIDEINRRHRGNPWVGAGNFKTREEAEKLKRQLVAAGKRVTIVVSAKGTSAENYGVAVMNPERSTPRRRRRDRRNPDEETQAVQLYQSFHGRDPKEIVEKHVSAAVRLEYTSLGDLEYLKVITPLGQKAQFNFDGDRVKLASSPDGKQLYAIGGNQDLRACLDKDSQEKDFIDLGEGQEVQYLARKVHGGFRPVSYFHKFGEVNGAKPRVMFDKLKKQIFFIGGEYLIDTSKGVSPGIEN